MIQFRGLYFPDSEKILPEHMAAQGNTMFAGAGTYQWTKLERALKLVKNFGHAVDVGANIGTWARPLARKFKQVTCFEPMPQFVECLRLNFVEEDKSHVTIHQVALGEQEGELEMRVCPVSSGWTHAMPTSTEGAKYLEQLHAKQAHMGNGKIEFEIYKTPVKTMDSFNLPKIDFLKIDVEGFEYYVVKGGVETIQRDRPVIIVEQKPGTPDRYGLRKDGAVKLLQKMGASLEFTASGDYCLRWR